MWKKDRPTISGILASVVIIGELYPLFKGVIEGVHEGIVFRIEDRKRWGGLDP